MATVTERVGILETKVDNIHEKIDEVKLEIREMHDCLDQTRDSLSATLKEMSQNAELAHLGLGAKISELEKFKTKWMYLIMGAIAVLGFASGHAAALLKLIS
jgi:uncharacterized coiled-coil DUF342 family protein